MCWGEKNIFMLLTAWRWENSLCQKSILESILAFFWFFHSRVLISVFVFDATARRVLPQQNCTPESERWNYGNLIPSCLLFSVNQMCAKHTHTRPPPHVLTHTHTHSLTNSTHNQSVRKRRYVAWTKETLDLFLTWYREAHMWQATKYDCHCFVLHKKFELFQNVLLCVLM